jgi:hypothetical protein
MQSKGNFATIRRNSQSENKAQRENAERQKTKGKSKKGRILLFLPF